LLNFIMQVQKFGETSPKKFGGQKHAKFGAILHNFRIWSRTSPERLKMSQIRKPIDRERFLPRSKKTSPVNFGPLFRKLGMWVWTHSNRFIHETIFQPLGVLAPEIFTRARDWPRLASAHHKPGRGPPKNFKGEQLKLGLKSTKECL